MTQCYFFSCGTDPNSQKRGRERGTEGERGRERMRERERGRERVRKREGE